MKKRNLSPEMVDEARRLKALFEANKKRLGITHETIGDMLGVSQGAISHYLNAVNPLNLNAATAFAKALGVEISEFSPRLQEQLEGFAVIMPEHSNTLGGVSHAQDLLSLEDHPRLAAAVRRLAALPEEDLEEALAMIEDYERRRNPPLNQK